jgi:hypothetical protein
MAAPVALGGAALGGIISGVGSLLGGLFGGGQKKKARKMLAAAKDPGYQIPKEFEQNLGQAEQMARVGMPSEQYNLAGTNIQRNTQAGLRQLGRMSNPFAGIAGLQRGQNDAFAQLDAQNAATRRQNILGAMGARSQLAGQKLAQQQYGQQRYMDQVNQANALMGAGMQNQGSAISGLLKTGLTMIGPDGLGKGITIGGGGGKQTMGQKLNLPQISRVPTPGLKIPPPSSSYKMPANVTLKTK